VGTAVRRVLELPSRLPTILKRGLRSSADQAARMSGILAHRERSQFHDLTVLTYHRVLAEARCANYPFSSLVMPLDAFRQQMRWLVSHGDVLPLSEALASRGDHAHGPTFALTFDDGYADAAELVAGVLEDVGIRGTFFVTTGFVGTRELLWFDRCALLFAAVPETVARRIVGQVCGERRADLRPRPEADGATWTRYLKGCHPEERAEILTSLERSNGGPPSPDGFLAMSVSQLAELHRRGHEVGSHTVSHAMLTDLDDAALKSELEGSRDAVSGWIGSSVPGFCYPDGDHDERVVDAVKRTGYAYACTTRQGVHASGSDRFRIRRVDVAPRRVTNGAHRLDVTAFRRELCGLYRRSE